MEQLASYWTDFPELLRGEGFIDNIKVWLRLSKNNGHVSCVHKCVYCNI
jgi:hypothetical protein